MLMCQLLIIRRLGTSNLKSWLQMYFKYYYIYLLIINILSGLFFSYDKRAATKKFRRIPERNLHLFELIGGVIINLLLMYLLRHKNKKQQYYSVTWAILLSYIFVLYYIS